MYQLLRTYLVGNDRKYELYGEADGGEKVTRVLEYAFLHIDVNDSKKSGPHWVYRGDVDISEFKDKSLNPHLIGTSVKSNDIHSIREYCKQAAMR